ncbi:MAG: prolyl oligopeptidase family serine peptidase [Bacteroidota bacterium]
MKNSYRFLLAAGLIALASCSTEQGAEESSLVYPKTRKDTTVVDDYFGVKVADPYRWLEDDNSKETGEWVKLQNEVTYGYLGKIAYRDKIKKRLTEIWNYEKVSTPWKKGKYYFFSKNNGVQNQSVLYVQEGLDGTPRVLLDPNTMDAAGTTSLGSTSVREDGKYMAYTVSKSGSDWSQICVMEIETGKVLPDTINWVKFSGASWKGDGFYYSAYPAPSDGHTYSKKNENNKVFYHKLGTKQSEDQVVYEDPAHPDWNFGMGVSDNGRIAALFTTESTSGNALSLKDLSKNGDWKAVDATFASDYNIVEFLDDNSVLIHTNNGAPRNRLIRVDVNNPAKDKWKTIIPENADLLQWVSVSGGKLVATYLHDVTTKLVIYSMDGKMEKEIPLPALGIAGFSGDSKSNTAFYSFTNYVTPTMIYQYDMQTGEAKEFFKPKVDVDPSQYESKQVFYNSKDGTRVPMFITYKKGTPLDGSAPCFLYGYGGFDISITPGFSSDKFFFIESGGIYAVANMRGGGEYGSEWHWAGTKCNKQNVFDDFIAAAEYLVKEKYTSHSRLAIHGRSNGGLLIGAVMTQRPDLAKVCLPAVGVLDMLRYHKFTIGYFWASDYGRSDSAQHFPCLYKYSPLHNIKETEYPCTMVTTGDHDDRVVPAHSFKFAAALQEKQKGKNPVLIRIDVNAGHGAGKPTSKLIEEWTDIWAFTFHNLGMQY